MSTNFGKAATSHDVAALAGVSQATVSRTLRQDPRVSPETRRRVLDAARALHYVPNRIGGALGSRQTGTVGLVTVDLNNSFYTQLVKEIVEEFTTHGYRTMLIMEPITGPSEVERYSMLLDGSLEGVLFTNATIGSAAPAYIAGRGLPVALAVRSLDDPALDSVESDNLTGGREAAQHVVGLGHREIALILGPTNTSTGRDREIGIREVLTASGIEVRPDWRFVGPYTNEHGYASTMTVLAKRPRPTALICGNDVVAIGALDAAAKLGVRVPDEVSIIGFDDIAMAGWETFRLTTVRQQTAEIGRLAARRLIERLRLPPGDQPPGRRDVFPMGLVRRHTTAPPPAEHQS